MVVHKYDSFTGKSTNALSQLWQTVLLLQQQESKQQSPKVPENTLNKHSWSSLFSVFLFLCFMPLL